MAGENTTKRLYMILACVGTVVFNVVYAASWITLVVFSSVKDVQQVDDDNMRLMCFSSAEEDIEDGYCSSNDEFPFAYSSSPICCTSMQYNPAYKIVHVIGGTLGTFQLFHFLASFLYILLFRAMNFVFLFESQIRTLLWITPSITVMFVHKYLVYSVMFCSYDASFCEHSSDERDIVNKVFESILTFAVVFFVLQVGFVGLFMWTFETKRRKTWQCITEIEKSLFLEDSVKDLLETQGMLDRTSTWHIKEFVEHWTKRNDDDIITELPKKAAQVMSVLRMHMDLNMDHRVSPDEFRAFCDRAEIGDRRSALWDILTMHGSYGHITQDSVEDLLYELFFHRKQLAYAIHTDLTIGTSIWLYMSATLFPGCFIVVSKIFEYKDAFSEGIDLFKTYAVIVSYIYTQLMGNLKFLFLMLKERPFNIGDVLDIEGQTYAVQAFTTTHTTLNGPCMLTIANDKLIQSVHPKMKRLCSVFVVCVLRCVHMVAFADLT